MDGGGRFDRCWDCNFSRYSEFGIGLDELGEDFVRSLRTTAWGNVRRSILETVLTQAVPYVDLTRTTTVYVQIGVAAASAALQV
jgi:hypothetical protein